jgi:cobalt-zinc-cadmium efflux system membrane fusion protein
VPFFTPKIPSLLRVGLLVFAVIGAAAALAWWKLSANPPPAADTSTAASSLQLVGKDTIGVPPGIIKSLGVTITTVAQGPPARPLEMYGQLVVDTDHLVRIRPRFQAEAVHMGRLSDQDPEWSVSKGEVDRPLRVGDWVKKGRLLVELFSKDLGEKKSEFADGLSHLWLDEDILERAEKAASSGGISDVFLLTARRNAEQDRIAVDRAERTLRSWGISDAELDDLRQEAKRSRQRGAVRDKEKWKRWAQVQIKAPFNGIIVEKNVGLGELVDSTISNPPLFQIADFSHPLIWAWPYEEDLPALQRAIQQAKPYTVPWTVRLKADPAAPAFNGHIEDIRPFIDPTQHTPAVTGRIDNPSGRWFLSGMSVQATVELPVADTELKIPATALFPGGADGRDNFVLVAADAGKIPAEQRKEGNLYFTPRKVLVVRRESRWVYVGAQSQGKPGTGIAPGDKVVAAGAIELRAAMNDLQSSGGG